MVTRKKLKPKWDRILIALVGLVTAIGCFYLIINFISGFFDPNDNLYCSNNSVKIARELTSQNIILKEDVGDTFFYGESLILNSSEVESIGQYNSYDGLVIRLVNICNQKEYNYTYNGKLDQFINVSDLPVGIYEFYLVNGENKIRLTSAEPIDTTIYTVTDGGTNYKVNLIADKSYFSLIDETYLLDDNYLFLDIKKEKAPENVYDVVVDPQYNDVGDLTESNDVEVPSKEATLLFETADKLAKELETMGYKVYVTRKSIEDPLETYGTNGRIHKTITSNAKYYIGLTMTDKESAEDTGVKVTSSYYASTNFSTTIIEQLKTIDGLTLYNDGIDIPETIRDYDSAIDIREMGGRALQAGSFSELTITENKDFALTDYGVQGISVSLGFIDGTTDFDFIDENQTKIVKAIANGFEVYLEGSE